jgi:FKBP-type peptidyl-prolyl cis-trans isomerase 2
MPVKTGDKIKVEYTGTLEDGTVFDSSEKQGKPLEFEVGTKQVIKGFEDAIVGMEPGEEKEIKLEPKDAYGDPNSDLVKKVPRDKLPQEDLQPGMMLVMKLPNGMQMPAKIIEVGDAEVTIDLNHPLSGKVLNFKLKVVEILK